MFGIREDKHFAIGFVFAVLALYSVTMYTYFLEKVSASAAVSHTPGSAAVSPEVNRILEVVNTENRALFHPIGTDDVVVPGSSCIITSKNLDSTNQFQNIPVECFQTEASIQQGN